MTTTTTTTDVIKFGTRSTEDGRPFDLWSDGTVTLDGKPVGRPPADRDLAVEAGWAFFGEAELFHSSDVPAALRAIRRALSNADFRASASAADKAGVMYRSFARIHVGTSPCGVEWYVYTGGKSKDEVEAEVALQRERLDALKEKHERGVVRVKITYAASDNIKAHYADYMEDMIDTHSSMKEDGWEADAAAFKLGKTFVEGTRRMLRDIASVLWEREDDDISLMSFQDMTEAQFEFAAKSIRKSRRLLARKIAVAIGDPID